MKKLFLSLMVIAPALALQAKTENTNDSATHHIDNIVVTGTRYGTDIRHLPMTLSVVGKDKLNENFQSNVLPTLNQQVPGLFTTSRSIIGYGVSTGAAGSIKLRGIGGMADLLVLIDGLPQYAGLYGHPIADSYQTMMADRIEVLRGPASVIYGSNAMGGVVNIVTRNMTQDGVANALTLQGGSYGTLEASYINRMRSGKWSTTAAANYSRTDGHRANNNFAQLSGFVKVGYDISPHWRSDANINITRFDSSNPGTTDNPYLDNDMKITRGVAALSLINDYQRTSGALRVYYNWGHHHINDDYHPGGMPQKALYLHNDRMGGFSLYQSYQVFQGNRTTLGVDYQHFGGHAWNRNIADSKETDITSRSINDIAGYIDVQQDLYNWLTLDAGLRIDHHSVSGNEWIPQGGFTVRLPRHARIQAMVSKGFRNATIRELYMFRPANKDLSPQRMMNYELAYHQELMGGALKYSANLFYLKADNLITTTMIGGKPLNINTGKTENSGVELEASYQLGRNLIANTNYSYLHMSNPQLSAPEHKWFAGATYQSSQYSVNAGLQYVGGLYTAVGKQEKKENFWLVNITARYHVLQWMQLFIKGDNLLAQRYQTIDGFPMPKATFMAGIHCTF